MKFLSKAKDGGPESKVWGYWLIELKWLFSIVLLRFEHGSRDAYHTHAFNSISWVLSGELMEYHHESTKSNPFDRLDVHWADLPWTLFFPVITRRTTNHMVRSVGRTWVLSFRGPWAKTWKETLPDGTQQTLTDGRKPA